MTNPVTYNCPHCRSPFSVIPTAQSQVVSCPSCRGQVTIGPAQPPIPPPTQAPVPPPPRQQQVPQPPPQQPMQPQYQQQQYQQQPYQQQYPQQYQQQPTQQQYQQPGVQQPTTPPKKSKKGLVIGVVVVVVILIVAVLAYLFVFAGEDGPKTYSATYEEFLNDLDVDESSFSTTFKTYDDGDIVDITGTVEKVKIADVPAGTTGADSGIWTIIYFEPPSPTTYALYDCFAYKGDKSDEYTVGEEGTIRVHIEKIKVLGITMEYPKEWMTADSIESYIQVPTAAFDFTETSPGNYTGGIVSASGDIYLSDIEIVIRDDYWGFSGSDDGDLTDDDPEEIDISYSDFHLEFTDVNDNNKLDAGDVFKLYEGESGDSVTIRDYDSWDTIASWEVP